jgi:hypothetical protein
MMRLARVPALVRRLATALALLAVLALGLHEAAHAAGSFAQNGQAATLAGQSHLYAAAPEHGKPDDGGPGKHHGAVPHSCHVCGTVMPMAGPTVAVPVRGAAAPAPAPATEHPGLDPGGPRRPPRAPVIA